MYSMQSICLCYQSSTNLSKHNNETIWLQLVRSLQLTPLLLQLRRVSQTIAIALVSTYDSSGTIYSKTNKTKTRVRLECSLRFLFRSLEACSSAKTTATARVSKTKTNSKRKQQETN